MRFVSSFNGGWKMKTWTVDGKTALEAKREEDIAACNEAVRVIDVFSYFVWSEGIVLSRKTHRKIGELAHAVQVSVKSVEEVMSIVIVWIFQREFPSLVPDGGLCFQGISARHKTTAEAMLRYYVEKYRYQMLSRDQL